MGGFLSALAILGFFIVVGIVALAIWGFMTSSLGALVLNAGLVVAGIAAVVVWPNSTVAWLLALLLIPLGGFNVYFIVKR